MIYSKSNCHELRWGHHFGINDEVICAVEEIMENKYTIFIFGRIAMFKNLWTKSIGVKDEYIKKQKEKKNILILPFLLGEVQIF